MSYIPNKFMPNLRLINHPNDTNCGQSLRRKIRGFFLTQLREFCETQITQNLGEKEIVS